MTNRSDSPEERFVARMRQEREARGWSQADLAAKLRQHGLNLHPATITKIEARDSPRPRSVRLEEAVAISDLLGVPLDQLLGTTPKYNRRAAVDLVRVQLSVFRQRLEAFRRDIAVPLNDVRFSDEDMDDVMNSSTPDDLELADLHAFALRLGWPYMGAHFQALIEALVVLEDLAQLDNRTELMSHLLALSDPQVDRVELFGSTLLKEPAPQP